MATGVWRATIVRADASGVYVTVPRLNRSHVFGPCPVLEGLEGLAGAVTGQAGDPVHAHPTADPAVTPLTAGDRVLVTFVEGRVNDVAVLGRYR